MPQRKKYNDVIGSFRALIVEDDVIVALDLELLLGSLGGKKVAIATTVDTAVEMLTNEQFDLCLLDYHLDDGMANRAVQLVLKKKIPHIFMTGDQDFVKKLGDKRQPNVLEKPFSHHDIKVAVAHVLGTALPESAQDFIDKNTKTDA